MPPKKKNPAKNAETPQPPELINPDDKKVFIKIISELENRIKMYQGICDHLTVTNGKYEKELSQQISEKKDITNYLKKNLQTKGLEIYEINSKLSAVKTEKENERQTFEGQLRQLRQEFQETKDALSVENITLAGKLSSLEEFKVQKEDILSKINKLESEIKENEAKKKEELYQLEKRNILDRHTLQKSTLQRLIDVSTKFREETNRQMAETTIRSIQENTVLSNDYNKLKKKCAAILEENKKLKEKESSQKTSYGISQSIIDEFAVKNTSLLSVVKLLTGSNKILKKKFDDVFAKLSDTELLKQQFLESQKNSKLHENELNKLEDEKAAITQDLEHLTSTERRNKEIIDKIYSTFDTISDFCELVHQFLNINVNSDIYETAKEELTQVMFSLLSSMNSIGVFNTKNQDLYQKLQSLPHEPDVVEMKESKLASRVGKSYHYRLGDVGIVPMDSDLLARNMKKLNSRLLGNNVVYGKYLVDKGGPPEVSVNILEDI